MDADVIVVGYGPVGQTAAALLAARGHRVAVYERFSRLYDLPRAVYFDDEIMQVWQSLGIVDELDVLPVKTYQWFGGREGRFDDIVGKGFALLTRQAAELPPAQAELLDRIGARVVALDELDDLDGRLTAWFDEHGLEAVLVRPDAYVFGAVDAPEALPALVDDLRSQLSVTASCGA